MNNVNNVAPDLYQYLLKLLLKEIICYANKTAQVVNSSCKLQLKKLDTVLPAILIVQVVSEDLKTNVSHVNLENSS
jgi:hypothetical protein